MDAALKWPNDVLAGGAKLAGILAEQAGDAIVIGVGLNVAATRDELPPPGPGALPATSLALLGAAGADRDRRCWSRILAELEDWYRRWTRPSPGDAEGSGLRAEYLRCSRDHRPGGPGGAAGRDGADRDGVRDRPGRPPDRGHRRRARARSARATSSTSGRPAEAGRGPARTLTPGAARRAPS